MKIVNGESGARLSGILFSKYSIELIFFKSSYLVKQVIQCFFLDIFDMINNGKTRISFELVIEATDKQDQSLNFIQGCLNYIDFSVFAVARLFMQLNFLCLPIVSCFTDPTSSSTVC